MRKSVLALLLATSLFGLGESTQTLEADFVQTIVDDKNTTITYEGIMLAKRPNMALWHYSKPVEKSVYIRNNTITIVEPELEQAIVKKLDNTVDILSIITSARKESKGHYTAFYHEKEYHIIMDDKRLKSIHYNDAFDNRVTITFNKQSINHKIANVRFDANIPEDFDVIKD